MKIFCGETRRVWKAVAALGLAAMTMTACATTKAATVVEGPPLAVPQPPERVLVPAEEEPLVATRVGPDTPLASEPRVQPSPLPTRRPPVRADDAKGETAPVANAAAVQHSGSTTEPRELRVVPSSTEVAADQARVQNFLQRAAADLKKVDPGKLSGNDVINFRESRRLSEQAVEALKVRNVNFALATAQKAAELAAALASR